MPNESGFILPLTLIIVAIGAMVVIGLLSYASGLFRAAGDDTDALLELYAADAGVIYVKKLMERQAPLGAISPIEVNGLEVTMRVIPVESPNQAVPPAAPVPINELELPDAMRQVHLVTLESAPEGTKLDISWAFIPPPPGSTPTSSTPTPIYPSIALYAQEPTGSPVALSDPLRVVVPDARNWTSLTVEDLEGRYVVKFDPGDLKGIETAAFTADPRECGRSTEPRFCLTTPPADYIVVSMAGSATVTTYLRHMPQWTDPAGGRVEFTYSGANVNTLSWKPYAPDE